MDIALFFHFKSLKKLPPPVALTKYMFVFLVQHWKGPSPKYHVKANSNSTIRSAFLYTVRSSGTKLTHSSHSLRGWEIACIVTNSFILLVVLVHFTKLFDYYTVIISLKLIPNFLKYSPSFLEASDSWRLIIFINQENKISCQILGQFRNRRWSVFLPPELWKRPELFQTSWNIYPAF